MHRSCPPKSTAEEAAGQAEPFHEQSEAQEIWTANPQKGLRHSTTQSSPVGTAQARTTTSSRGLLDVTYSWREQLSSCAHSKCQSTCAEDIKTKVTMKYCGEWRSSSCDCSALYHHQVFSICPPWKGVFPEMPYKISHFTYPWGLLMDCQPVELCHRSSLSM